jgi:hypothetical protein
MIVARPGTAARSASVLSTGSKITAAVIVFLFALFDGTAAAATTVFSEDFENAKPGPLEAPWTITSAGASTAVVVATADHGRVLDLRGSPASGDFLIASRGFSSSATEIEYSFAINPSAGSSFVTALNGSGTSVSARRIRLQQDPGTTTLTAQTSISGTTPCAVLAPGAWSTVTLRVHAAALTHTFDVLVNGVQTKCTGISTGLSAPFTGLNVMDASNAGFGGSVLFDDFLVTTP